MYAARLVYEDGPKGSVTGHITLFTDVLACLSKRQSKEQSFFFIMILSWAPVINTGLFSCAVFRVVA